jgi:hypothetical protein
VVEEVGVEVGAAEGVEGYHSKADRTLAGFPLVVEEAEGVVEGVVGVEVRRNKVDRILEQMLV